MTKTEKVLTREEFEALREPAPDDALPPDWQVFKVTDLGAREYYRFRVEGFNLSERDEPGRLFIWNVPKLSHRYFMGSHYFTVIIPWSDTPTRWHPTEKTGIWNKLSRGAFMSEDEAHAWAKEQLAEQPYYLKAFQGAEYSDDGPGR